MVFNVERAKLGRSQPRQRVNHQGNLAPCFLTSTPLSLSLLVFVAVTQLVPTQPIFVGGTLLLCGDVCHSDPPSSLQFVFPALYAVAARFGCCWWQADWALELVALCLGPGWVCGQTSKCTSGSLGPVSAPKTPSRQNYRTTPTLLARASWTQELAVAVRLLDTLDSASSIPSFSCDFFFPLFSLSFYLPISTPIALPLILLYLHWLSLSFFSAPFSRRFLSTLIPVGPSACNVRTFWYPAMVAPKRDSGAL